MEKKFGDIVKYTRSPVGRRKVENRPERSGTAVKLAPVSEVTGNSGPARGPLNVSEPAAP